MIVTYYVPVVNVVEPLRPPAARLLALLSERPHAKPIHTAYRIAAGELPLGLSLNRIRSKLREMASEINERELRMVLRHDPECPKPITRQVRVMGMFVTLR